MSTRTLQNYLNTLPTEEAANLESVLALNNLTNLVKGEPGGGGVPTGFTVIAANDSSTEDKTGADVVCDGTADQVEINAQLSNGNVHLLKGTYNISDNVILPSNRILQGSGPESVITPAEGTMAGWTTYAVTTGTALQDYKSAVTTASHDINNKVQNITIRDLVIDGNRIETNNEPFSCLHMDAVRNMTASGLIIKNIPNSTGDARPFGIFISRCDGVVVEKCKVGDGGYDGISLRDRPINVVIKGCYVWGSSMTSSGAAIQMAPQLSTGDIDGEDEDTGIGYIAIVNNHLFNFESAGLIHHSGSRKTRFTIIANNFIVGLDGVQKSSCMHIQYPGEELLIANNYMRAQGDSADGTVAFKIWNGSSPNPNGINIVGNIIRAPHYPLRIEELRHAVISNNNLIGGFSGIYVMDETTSRLAITGNVIRSGSSNSAIRLHTLTHSLISGNVISCSNSDGRGILIEQGGSNMISNNVITDIQDTAPAAIELQVGADNSFVHGNLINPNTSIVDDGAGNTVNNNMGNI